MPEAGRGPREDAVPAASFAVAVGGFHLALAGGAGPFLAIRGRGFFGLLALRPLRAAPGLAVVGGRDRAAFGGSGAKDDLAFLRRAALQRLRLGLLIGRLVPARTVVAGRLV